MTSKPTRVHARALLAASLLALGVLSAACGGSTGRTARADSPTVGVAPPSANATLQPGDEIPAPAGAMVLRVTGLIDAGAGAPVEFDMATLDQIGLQTFSVYEPFVEQDMTFQGIDMGDLLAVLGPVDEATELHLVALDDYIVNLKVDDVRSGGTMLATHNGDGSPIAVEEGGPIRVVFLHGADAGPTPNEWIWSLASAELR